MRMLMATLILLVTSCDGNSGSPRVTSDMRPPLISAWTAASTAVPILPTSSATA